MNSLVGGRADRAVGQWARLVFLPGLPFVTALVVVWPCTPWRADVGFRDALRISRLPDRLVEFVGSIFSDGATVVVAAALFVLTSLLAGQAAAVAASVVERVWLGVWPIWMAAPLVRHRLRSWSTNDAALRDLHKGGQERIDVEALAAARARQGRIGLVEPQRPTWMGDRIAAVEALLDNTYHLPLRACWSRLWMVMPDRAREDVRSGSQAFRAQTLAAGWGLLCVVTAIYWWPACLVGLAMLTVAWRRGRHRLDQFAELVEASVDLYSADLARALGLTVNGSFTTLVGEEIRAIVVKTE